MAKAKKKESLTPEERLQAALVPESEQPYPVSANWCWVRLSSISQVISKGTTPKGGKNAYSDHGVKFLRVENINDDGTISHDNIAYVSEELHYTFLKRSILEENDILVSIAGTLGKTGIVRSIDLPMNTNQAVAFVRISSGKINRWYIKNAIDNPVIQTLLLSKTKVTSIPNLTLEIIGECPIPLPPLPEQQRIVDRIESLFAKLDEAKQKAQDALDSFETRKAAILHKAFTGELTAQWRKEHGVGMESWKNTTMGEIASFHQGVQVAVDEQFEDYEENRVRFIRIVDYTQGTERERYVSCDKIRNESYVKGDEIVMVRYGATAGFVGGGIEGLIANNMFVVDVKKDIREYIKVFLKSPAIYHELNTSGGSTAMPALNFKTASAIEVPLPSEKEQTEIVRILDDLLAKEQQAKEAAEGVLEQIDLMKKAILARAFRGELGTNDPREESAVELLKQISSCLPG